MEDITEALDTRGRFWSGGRRNRHHHDAVLQSLSRARNKWGDHAASTIWDASIVKAILGGASTSKDLQELAVLIGERDERSDDQRLRRPLRPAI